MKCHLLRQVWRNRWLLSLERIRQIKRRKNTKQKIEDAPKQEEEDLYRNDLGSWGNIFAGQTSSFSAKTGREPCQNKYVDFFCISLFFFFPKSFFNHKLNNKEFVYREWLTYSTLKGSVICFACKIFGENKEMPALEASYEGCHSHKLCFHANFDTVASEKNKKFTDKYEYWTQVLQRIVTVVKYVAERELAFNGERSQVWRYW